MKRILLVIMVLAASQVAGAAEPCAIKIANLLSAGKAADLSAMFEKPALGTQDELSALAVGVGSLSNVIAATKPRFRMHQRISVKSQGLPSSFSSLVFRANAVSAKLGEVQLHVDVKPGTQCKVMALHIDQPVK